MTREWTSPDGRIRLINGDCLQCLPIEADAVISDPPYGMDWDARITCGPNGHGKRGAKGSNFGTTIQNDKEPFDPTPWLGFDRVVLWGMNHFAARLPIGTNLVWIKKLDSAFGTFLSDAEVAWMKGGHGVYCRRDMTMWAKANDRLHTNEKPVGLIAWCMEKARVPADALVLDPYMGSGTTGIACYETGRRFIGIEIDPDHYDTAVARIQKAMQQPALPFDTPPQPQHTAQELF